jgi:prepilin-type processing-associated H-X9-DG protein
LNKYSKSPLLYRCPSDKAKLFIDWSKPLNRQPADARWSSFALNALLDPDCYLYNGIYNRTIHIKRPGKCIYISECPESWTNADHLHPDLWESLDQAKGSIADRHSKTSNYTFTDGHAENLKFEETWDYPTINYWLPDSAPGWPKN